MTTTPDYPPLVEAYLADLDRALAAADPRERAETLAAMREHAAELLARYGSDDESARRVLDDLGPVETIAAEVTPAPAPVAPATVATAGTTEATDVVLVVLAILVWPLSPVALVWAIVRLRARVGNRALQWLTVVLGAIPTLGGIFLLLLHTLSLMFDAQMARDLIGQRLSRNFAVSANTLVLTPTDPTEGWRVTYER